MIVLATVPLWLIESCVATAAVCGIVLGYQCGKVQRQREIIRQQLMTKFSS
jgi:hypothetical protein